MNIGDIILLSIGILLVLGAFISAWVFFRIMKQMEANQKYQNNAPVNQSNTTTSQEKKVNNQ